MISRYSFEWKIKINQKPKLSQKREHWTMIPCLLHLCACPWMCLDEPMDSMTYEKLKLEKMFQIQKTLNRTK